MTTHLELKSFPQLLPQFTHLTAVFLQNTGVVNIPEEFYDIETLAWADLSSNKIRRLSSSIGKMHRLRQLNLSTNLLRELPKEMAKLTQLHSLSLVENELPNQFLCNFNREDALNILVEIGIYYGQLDRVRDAMYTMLLIEKHKGFAKWCIPPEILFQILDQIWLARHDPSWGGEQAGECSSQQEELLSDEDDEDEWGDEDVDDDLFEDEDGCTTVRWGEI